MTDGNGPAPFATRKGVAPYYSTRANRLIALLALLVAFAPMSIDIYLPALPAIAADLAASADSVQMSLAVFFLGSGLGQLVYGPLSDRFGRRPVILSGCVIYIVTSALCALSHGVDQLILLRLLQALGASAATVCARACVRDVFSGDQAARALSLVMLVMSMAPLIAPTLGGQLLAWFGWRSIFWLLAGFGITCLLAVIFILKETHPPERRQRGGPTNVLLGYLSILRHRETVGCMLTTASAFGGMFAFFAGSPFIYIEIYGVPADRYGLLFALNVVGLIILGYANSRLVVRLGARRLLGVGTILTALAGLSLLAAATTGFGALYGLAVPIFVYIAALAPIGANAQAIGMQHFAQRAGAVSALFGSVQFSIGALTGTAVGALHSLGPTGMAVVMCATGLCGLTARYTLVRSKPEAERAG